MNPRPTSQTPLGWIHRWIITATLALFISSQSPAFVAEDADTAFNAFNNRFYSSNGNAAYYKETTAGGRAWFWTQANMIEMATDAYARTGHPWQRDMITALCKGFVENHGTDWSDNEYNDDIQWACIVFAKAYRITGNTSFRERAISNFNMMWDRSWSSHLGGGLWWRTDNQSKNACSNSPAAIAACLLYEITGDPAYLTKAQQAVAWVKANLVEPTGVVRDHKTRNGNVIQWTFSYNQGTYVGACNYLHQLTGDTTYFSEALRSTRYMRDHMCGAGGIFPDYGGGDGAGFNGIGIRWMAQFIKDQHQWAEFYPWLKANADAAWNVRRADNLSWNNWTVPTAAGTRFAFECFGTVTALQVIPATYPESLPIVITSAEIEGTHFHLRFTGTPSTTYLVRGSIDLSSFLLDHGTATTNEFGIGEASIPITPGSTRHFYRIERTTPPE